MAQLVEAFPFPGSRGDTWPYTEALRAGDYLFVSGQGPLDMVAEEIIDGSIEAQTDLTLRNLQALLESAGSGLHQVVKTCVHLADMADFDAMGRVYGSHFAAPRPARITVQSVLWRGIRVEIDAVAYAPPRGRLVEAPDARAHLRQRLPPDRAEARLVSMLQDLSPAVVCDVLDRHGYRHQAMSSQVRPLWPEAETAGVVQTVHCRPVDGPPPQGEEYRLLFQTLDALQPGQVLVADRVDSCFWGELMSEAALRRGCRGVVVDGYCRDTRGVVALGFPAFVRGVDCRDFLGRAEVQAAGVPIECAGVRVAPGDYLIGDIDGVVVIPRDLAATVIPEAHEKVQGESLVRARLREGMPVTEAWRR
ncbi:MAG: Rid family hydrolase, partial [Gemmatimonadota bacterium]